MSTLTRMYLYISGGVKKDAQTFVCVAEGEGVVMRNSDDGILCVCSEEILDAYGRTGNLALAGYNLVVLVHTKLWVI